MTTQPPTTPTEPPSLNEIMSLFTTLTTATSAQSDPKPRKAGVPADPSLPTDLLPPAVETWLHDTALLAGVPPVMTTLPFLAATGGVIGNRLGLQLHPGWTEYPSIWVALVALTGTGKTPALLATRHPFDLLHEELRTATEQGQTSGPASALVIDQAAWPRLERALGHANGLILHRDELVGLLHAINSRRSEDRQHYLSLWSAEPIVRHQESTIHHPVVSIIGGIQPLLLHQIHNRQSDGLMERFLIIVASNRTTTWNHNLPTSAPAVEPILSILRTLRSHQPGHRITFDTPATNLWGAWYDANNSLHAPDPKLMVPLGFYRKYPIHLARLALVIHALWHPHEPAVPLSAATLDRAITLIEYIRIQHHRSLAFINQSHAVMNPGDAFVGRILDIFASDLTGTGWLPRAQLAIHLHNPPSALLTSALATLHDAKLIEQRTVKTAGRPATEYRLLSPTQQQSVGKA